ncbi:NAD(P)-binding protein [Coprinellus micaceus]|uniref:NAD(P)-binding protein n=1 Tax=Coprinellus micaceus TaxID=71717 RepID=A0A4Y7T4R7_COPMI|nr:NAD(P)-binding protein [Coprinellus micaceus]
MPVLTSTNSKVLVTGANGYIGAWVVKTLLGRGYSVRAVVRNLAKADILKGLFASHVEGGKLEFAYVANLVEVTTIRPAVDGTLGILKSALKNGKDVKRIGITSSSGSLAATAPLEFLSTPTTFTEADWNDAAIRAVQEGSTHPLVAYAASKTLAEKAAWEFHNAHKPAWDITTLNPPLVYGPTLLPAKAPADIGGTQGIWYGTVIAAGEKDKEQLGEKNGYAWVDVRDVAEAHVRSLEKEEAGGERIIVSSWSYIWQEWFDAATS